MNATISIRATREEVRQVMGDFVAALSGRSTNHAAAVHGVKLRIATTLLSMIQQDFITKSRGGTGVDGITWKPLSREYLAYGRRFGPGEQRQLLKAAGAKNRGGARPLLTAAQDQAWRREYARARTWLMARGADEGEASSRAAAIAWEKIKAQGGQTKKEVFGNRKADILRDTGELLRSFSPGVAVQRLEPGTVIVGTNKKPWHHATRPFWPKNGDLPPAYWNAILLAARRGILEAATQILASRAA